MTTLSTIKAEAVKRFESEFCNNHQKPIRFLRSVFYDEQDGAEQIEQFLLSEIDRAVSATMGDLEKWAKKVTTGNNGGKYPWIALNDLLQKLSSLKEKP